MANNSVNDNSIVRDRVELNVITSRGETNPGYGWYFFNDNNFNFTCFIILIINMNEK